MGSTRRRLRDLVVDLVAWGEAVERSVGRTGREAIVRDKQAELALARAVEVVGEIAGRLLTPFPERWGEEAREELRNACRMRKRLTLGYDDVEAPSAFRHCQRRCPASHGNGAGLARRDRQR